MEFFEQQLHIIIKARITMKEIKLRQKRNKTKKKIKETEPDSNLTRARS